MEFWDEIYKKMTDVADYTVKETGKLTESAKLRFNLMREKNRLEDAYKNMGELYYKQMKAGEFDEGKISLAYDKIEKSIVEIERLEDLISLIGNVKNCSNCGEKLTKDMAFCPACGAKQEDKE